MKVKELNLQEIEVSLTLGGTGEGRVQGRGKLRGCRCYDGVKHCHVQHTQERLVSPIYPESGVCSDNQWTFVYVGEGREWIGC
jgi:hypothetical protein